MNGFHRLTAYRKTVRRADLGRMLIWIACVVAATAGPAAHAQDSGAQPVHDNRVFGQFLADRLEYFNARGSEGLAWDFQGWVGRDYNKLWIKTEGTRSGGKTEDARVEALWARAVGTYWDLQAGVRHDISFGSRNWLALGVQGLAPYWFDVEATAYVGPEGRTAAILKTEYDLLITQRLIFTPRAEATLYGKSDSVAHVGSGLSDVQLGARLRYEFSRQFAPYIGVEWEGKYGRTATFARQAGTRATDGRVVVGLRAWF